MRSESSAAPIKIMTVIIPVGNSLAASLPLKAKGPAMPPADENVNTIALAVVFLVYPATLGERRLRV